MIDLNERQEILLRTLLGIMEHLDGPAAEALLHASLQSRLQVPVSLAEFESTLRCCERERWITGVPGALQRLRWTINARGRTAVAEMNA